MSVEIRAERSADRDRSLEIERLAFGSEEEVAIVEAVRDEDGSFALVAEEDGEVVGHVQLSRACIGENPVLAFGPIGVVSPRQREGIGSALMRSALDEARARSEPAVTLLGDPGFYPRFGFEPASALGWRSPFTGVQPNGVRLPRGGFHGRGGGRPGATSPAMFDGTRRLGR